MASWRAVVKSEPGVLLMIDILLSTLFLDALILKLPSSQPFHPNLDEHIYIQAQHQHCTRSKHPSNRCTVVINDTSAVHRTNGGIPLPAGQELYLPRSHYLAGRKTACVKRKQDHVFQQRGVHLFLSRETLDHRRRGQARQELARPWSQQAMPIPGLQQKPAPNLQRQKTLEDPLTGTSAQILLSKM